MNTFRRWAILLAIGLGAFLCVLIPVYWWRHR